MNYSKQRELIYQTVLQNPIHPSADTVYALVRRDLPNISLGTVYRNLNLLAEQGDVRKISMPNVSDHFDSRIDEHCHVLCEKCGNVYDAQVPGIIDFEENLRLENNKLKCHIYFTGICEACLNESPDADK